MTTTAPKIESRAAFGAAVQWAFAHAFARHARTIVCVDPGFADWPLDDPTLLAGLTGWLKQPKRRLVLLAADFEAMARQHARFVQWRVDWAHAIETWGAPDDLKGELPTALVDDADLSLELTDSVHWRGRVELDARSARLLRERIDVVLQRSEPAFPVNTLGL